MMLSIILFSLTINWVNGQQYQFGDLLPSQHKLLTDLKQNRRILEANGEWDNIRIQYEYVEEPSKNIQELTATALDVVKTFFGRFFLVKRFNQTLKWDENYESDLGVLKIPKELQKSYEADLVFFVGFEYDNSVTYVARATPIYFDTLTGRPIFSLIILNKYYYTQYTKTNANFETAVQILIHETVHGLGFTSSLYQNYIDSTTNSIYNTSIYKIYQRVNNQIELPFPRLKQLVKNHFGCSCIIGATLEDYGIKGTQGSHLEKSLFYNEIMTGSINTGDIIISEFTFGILEDTGFYRALSHQADTQLWGKDKGCHFYKEQCFANKNFDEFCSNPYNTSLEGDSPFFHLGCNYEHTGVSMCSMDNYTECPYKQLISWFDCRDPDNFNETRYKNLNFHFGHDSMCVQGSLTSNSAKNNWQHSCFQYSCDEDNKLSIIVDGVSYDCSEDGTEPDFDKTKYSIGFTCPNKTQELCQQKNECPNQCNKRGYCLGGTCTCQPGYSGRACDQTCDAYRNDTSCVTTCPENTVADENSKYCIGCPANCLSCTAKYNCTECADSYKLVGGFCDPEYSIVLSFFAIVGLFFI